MKLRLHVACLLVVVTLATLLGLSRTTTAAGPLDCTYRGCGVRSRLDSGGITVFVEDYAFVDVPSMPLFQRGWSSTGVFQSILTYDDPFGAFAYERQLVGESYRGLERLQFTILRDTRSLTLRDRFTLFGFHGNRKHGAWGLGNNVSRANQAATMLGLMRLGGHDTGVLTACDAGEFGPEIWAEMQRLAPEYGISRPRLLIPSGPGAVNDWRQHIPDPSPEAQSAARDAESRHPGRLFQAQLEKRLQFVDASKPVAFNPAEWTPVIRELLPGNQGLVRPPALRGVASPALGESLLWSSSSVLPATRGGFWSNLFRRPPPP